MAKEKVLSFYVAFFLFVLAIASIQFWAIGGITGFAVSESRVYSFDGSEEFGVSVSKLEYQRTGVYLVVDYYLKENLGVDKDLIVEYFLIDSRGNEVISGRSSANLPANSEQKFRFWEELPKDSFGEYNLSLKLVDYGSIVERSYPLFLPKSSLTGMAISEENKSTIQYAVFGVIFVVLLFWIWNIISGKRKIGLAGKPVQNGKSFRSGLIPIKPEEVERERNV